MVEVQDTVIKLFGKKISLPEYGKTIVSSGSHYAGESRSNPDLLFINMNNKTCLEAKKVDIQEAHKDQNLAEESANSKASQISKDDDESDKSNPKTVKKPDKIIACPRCNSMDTKFCYYNNYNTNQPRHFCKSCQRYWTNGGSMRNVPVGSGRRKNKNQLSASYYLHNHEESLEVARVNSGILVPDFESNGKLLRFDSAPQLCNPVASVFSLADKRAPNHGILGARKGIQDPKVQNFHGFSYLSGVPWPYPVYPVPYLNHNPWFSSKAISGSSFPVLGKHSRDGELLNQNILVPGILGIDGPDEAANSFICREGLFKGFEAKCGKKKHIMELASPVLQANPAAMCRSLNFKERA